MQPLRMRHDYGTFNYQDIIKRLSKPSKFIRKLKRSEDEEFNPNKLENYIEKLNQRAKILLRNLIRQLNQVKILERRKSKYPIEKHERYDREIDKWKNLLKNSKKDYNEIVQIISAEVDELNERLDETEDKKLQNTIKRILRKGQKYLDYHEQYL